jgi:Protein of unknown function (DUF3455)
VTKSLIPLTLFALTMVIPAAAHRERDDRTPDLGACQKLRVEAGNRVALHAYAEGVQIYRWNGTSWTFIAPDAQLFPDDDAQTQVFGIHYVGPTWESTSGSSVRGALDDLCVSDPNALPWLRLRAVSSEGPGLFLGTTFIQRLNTVGGIAPTFSGSVVGEEARVPYTADYYFYKAHP